MQKGLAFWLLIFILGFLSCGHPKKKDLNLALFKAVKKGDGEKVKALIKKGANVNARRWKEWTPLHCAAEYGRTEVAKVLISHGANVNAKDDWN